MGVMLLKPASRYPIDPRVVFILALSVFVGATALAVDIAPDTLDRILPRWGLVTWDLALVAGSALSLIGMAFRGINGIITEQVGSVMIAAATLFYAGLALWVPGSDDLSQILTILTWGLACAVRWVQLQLLINRDYRRQIHDDVRRAVLNARTTEHEGD